MSLAKTIKDDIVMVKEHFPKLKLLNSDGKPPSFSGILDICDETGYWYGSFDIHIHASSRYPHGVPRMFETGGVIQRIADRHINDDGSCCVGIDHVLLHRAAKGFTTHAYLLEFAWPYFANQLYFKENGYYAEGEYHHGFAGVIQFYRQSLNIADPAHAVILLSGILDRNLPVRNDQCFCGSKRKFKYCHMSAAEYLAKIDYSRLKQDLHSFSTCTLKLTK